MSLSRLGTLIVLELTQRIRSVAWYVLLGVFALILVAVTLTAFAAFGGLRSGPTGAGVYSTVVYVVLLLAMLVSPTLSGNAINGDRDAATLAPVQVTLATTGEIVLGKFLAAWVAGLAFAVVAAPFLLVAMILGGVSADVVVVSLLVLIAEIGVVAAVGVGVSGLIARPLFSVAVTYLVVAALTVGTILAFALGGASVRSEVVAQSRTLSTPEGWSPDCGPGRPSPGYRACTDEDRPRAECGAWETHTYSVARPDYFWGVLAANPFVILADATPGRLDAVSGQPIDLFGQIKLSVRRAQQAPPLTTTWDGCDLDQRQSPNPLDPPEQVFASTVPSWFVGLLVQAVLAAALLVGAWARTRTPARRLPPGTRIA